jgi:hypothetical protein
MHKQQATSLPASLVMQNAQLVQVLRILNVFRAKLVTFSNRIYLTPVLPFARQAPMLTPNKTSVHNVQ